jgi:DNA-binding GntR family transcriptional regulator
MPTIKSVRHATLADQAYEAIKDAVLALELRPGDALVEDDLAEQIGMSKTPVRQALERLEREGLVVRIPYKATYVADLDPADAADILELRAVLEGLAARSVVEVVDDATLDAAEEILDAYDAAVAAHDMEAAEELGERFHGLVSGASTNRHVARMLETLNLQLQRLRALSGHHHDRAEKSGREHRAILAALRNRDA